MDSQATNAATPSKAGRESMNGAADLSTPGPEFGSPAMMDVSSPDPAPFSFARQKHPPAISSKPRSSRKVSSLFSSDTGEAAGSSDAAGAADASKKGLGDESSMTPAGGSLCAGGEQAASPATDSGGGSGGAGFTSPVRASREPGATNSRFTPQRNLGGLFASPLPPPPPTTNDEEGVTASSPRGLTAALPLLLQMPKREEPLPAAAAVGASCAPVDEAASPRTDTQTSVEKSPTSTAAAKPATTITTATTTTAVVTPSPVAALAPAAPAPAPAVVVTPAAPVAVSGSSPVCQCGCSSSSGATGADCGDVCCVSNEAFKDRDGKAMRTLEVLVKRERVGVTALASWRVAELKRRLVHLKLFPATTEAIALVPAFPVGGAALEDDVVLDTLDADVAYKARRVAAAAAT